MEEEKSGRRRRWRSGKKRRERERTEIILFLKIID
jgi:hypothetical protein